MDGVYEWRMSELGAVTPARLVSTEDLTLDQLKEIMEKQGYSLHYVSEVDMSVFFKHPDKEQVTALVAREFRSLEDKPPYGKVICVRGKHSNVQHKAKYTKKKGLVLMCGRKTFSDDAEKFEWCF
jgi:hypothetical protein